MLSSNMWLIHETIKRVDSYVWQISDASAILGDSMVQKLVDSNVNNKNYGNWINTIRLHGVIKLKP